MFKKLQIQNKLTFRSNTVRSKLIISVLVLALKKRLEKKSAL